MAEGNCEKILELLSQGADPNSIHTNSYTVLMHAVRAWKPSPEQIVQATQMLLANGADPSYIAKDGYQALTLTRDIEVVAILLDAGVNVTPAIGTELMYHLNGNKKIKSLLHRIGIQTDWTDSVRQIYERIYEYDDRSLYYDILEDAIPFLQNCLHQLNHCKIHDVTLSIPIEDAYTLYALSRINELLLLNFQNNSTSNNMPTISLAQYTLFWQKVGFTVYEPKEFHPFLCEIYEVEECSEQKLPRLISSRWPCLFFGELLFSRASASVAAHSDHIHKKIAEKSTLYWCHKRSDRKYTDLSCGWGHNSQWSTTFRCDYWSNQDLIYNANHPVNRFDNDELSEAQRLEILRYRCFVKTPEVEECFPYNYHTTEKYKTNDVYQSAQH